MSSFLLQNLRQIFFIENIKRFADQIFRKKIWTRTGMIWMLSLFRFDIKTLHSTHLVLSGLSDPLWLYNNVRTKSNHRASMLQFDQSKFNKTIFIFFIIFEQLNKILILCKSLFKMKKKERIRKNIYRTLSLI